MRIRMYHGLLINFKDNTKKKKVSSLISIVVLKYWLQVIVRHKTLKWYGNESMNIRYILRQYKV